VWVFPSATNCGSAKINKKKTTSIGRYTFTAGSLNGLVTHFAKKNVNIGSRLNDTWYFYYTKEKQIKFM